MKYTNQNRRIGAILLSLIIIALIIPFSGLERVFAAADPLFAKPAGEGTRSDSYASIEADPPRLSSPGYVTVIVRLRNLNPAAGGESIGIPEAETGISDNGDVFIQNFDPIPTSGPTEPPKETPEPGEPTPPPATGGGAYTHISIVNNYGVTFSTYDVPAGSTGTFRGSMYVSEDMIGQPLSFTIYWYDTAAEVTYYQSLSLRINRTDTAYLRLTRTASVTSAAVGEKVELTYTMVNTGTRRLTNIVLVDEKIAGRGAMLTPFSLSSGEKKEFVYTYTMQEASVVSKPTATFTPEGGSTALTVTVTNLTIGLINAQISKSVNVGTPTAEGVMFTLFLTNNGSQNLSSLVVKNDLDETLSSGFSLAIGESRIIEHFVPNPDSVRNVFFTITGSYSSGKEFRDTTKSYTVRPYIDPSLLGLKFRAEIVKPLNSEGHIVLSFSVTNTGNLPYANVVLTEKELGYQLHEIPQLMPSSQAETFNVDLTLDEPRELVFYLDAVDPSGNSYRFEAFINAEYSDLNSAVPDETPEPGTDDDPKIVDIDVEKQINERGEQLIAWWKKLRIIFFVVLGIMAVLSIAEISIYFAKKRRSKQQ